METNRPAALNRRDGYFFGAFALAKVLISGLTSTGYGYFRDELYYIECAKHLAWGYVDHPPLSIAVLALFRAVLGDSQTAIHLPAILIGAATVVLAGLIAREMGGGRFAQGIACLCVLLAPVYLAMTTFYSMNPFDQFFWALGGYIIVRLIVRDDPRLWLWFGLVCGLGLQNKISVLFFGFGVVVAMLFTPHRKHLAQKFIWLGGAIAAVVFLPHIVWQMMNGWPTIEFTRNAALYKNAPQGPLQFLLNQLLMMGPLTAVVWIAGILYGIWGKEGRRFRWISLTFVTVFLVLSLTYGKDYYLAPAFPMVLALGGVWIERATMNRTWVRPIAAGALTLVGCVTAPLVLPMLPIETVMRYQSALGISAPKQERNQIGEIPQHFSDRFGWPELARFVADAYAKLSPEDREKCCILVSNYGEAGAINFFGPEYGLPSAITGHNNYFLWGPGTCTGEVMLVYASTLEELQQFYAEVSEVGRFHHPYVMPYETDRPLFLCKGLKGTLSEAWPLLKDFM